MTTGPSVAILQGLRVAQAAVTECWPQKAPRSGSKAEDGEKREKEREKERAKVGENNGQATHGARKPPGPKQYVLAMEKEKMKKTVCLNNGERMNEENSMVHTSFRRREV